MGCIPRHKDPRVSIFKQYMNFNSISTNIIIARGTPNYVSIYHNQQNTALKFVFKSEYSEGDASITKNNNGAALRINSAHIGKYIDLVKQIPIYQSLSDPYVWYLPIDHKSDTVKPYHIVDNDTWIQDPVIIRNTKDVSIFTITYCPQTTTCMNAIFSTSVSQLDKYPKFFMSKSIYFDYDTTINKVAIKFNHPFKYGHNLYNTMYGNNACIDIEHINMIYGYYGKDLIDKTVKKSHSHYFKIGYHPTDDGVYVIEDIYTTQSCMVNANECEK